MVVHQTALHSINTMRSHELDIMIIGQYMVDNPYRGVIYMIDETKGLEVYVDADFEGGWDSSDS